MVDFLHKVLVPQRPANLVVRSRLTDQLKAITERRLVVLTAPAGYGKTSLLIDFAANQAQLPVCWYTLDRFDADPWTFLNYLAAAVIQRFPAALSDTRRLLASREQAALDAVVAAMVRELYALGEDLIIVIDDWHLVDHVPEISELIAQILVRCPNCRLILASRSYPGLPDLMLLAARRQLSGLDAEALRFTADEVAAVLSAEYHRPFTLSDAAALTERTNGWITGILLAVQAQGEALTALPDQRAERQVYRFLAEQVLGQQRLEVQEFLLASALLDELSAERCDQLFNRSDSAQLIDTLLRQHIFVTEIKPGALRYHPLFREFLQEQYRTVTPERYRATALRVAEDYLQREHWSAAFETYLAAGELGGAHQVVAVGGEQLYASGRLETLERWFAMLPPDSLAAPQLRLKALVQLNRGQLHEAQVLAELARTRMQRDDEPLVLLTQAQVARAAGKYEAAIAAGERALELASDQATQARALRLLAICHQRTGQTGEAIGKLERALTIERERGDLQAVAQLQHDLGVCHEESGRLRSADEYYTQADAYWATVGNAGRRASSLNSKGVVQHLAGRYHEAQHTLQEALRYARQAAAPHYEALALASLGDLYSDLQLWERAAVAYADARQAGSSAYLSDYLTLAEIQLRVRRRQYEAAASALQHLDEATINRHADSVALIRGWLAVGRRDWQSAVESVADIISRHAEGRPSIDLARAYLLRATCAADSSTHVELCASLDQARQIAADLGHDAFLIVACLHASGLLRRALAARWPFAVEWAQRQEELLLVARMIGDQDKRPFLMVRTLGDDRIMLNGTPVNIGWLKAREVFYYLLANPNGASPEQLREAIWPELPADRSRQALKTAVYQLRSALPRELIELQNRQVYRINRESVRIDWDVECLLAVSERRDAPFDLLEQTLDLYHGPFLPASDNQWSSALRSHLEQRFLLLLRNTAAAALASGLPVDALAFYRRIIDLDPLNEAAHAGVMRCQLALGNRAAAIDQYRTLCRILDDELGLSIERGSEVERLYVDILNT